MDVGISVEVSNALLDRNRFDSDSPAAYGPDWIGTVERLEDGVRYVYECSYDQNRNEIIYAKKRYNTGEVIDQDIYDGETAERKDLKFP